MSQPIASIRAIDQKLALRAMLAGNTRPPKSVADVVGVAGQTLMGWADEHVDSHLPGARIPALLVASDDLALVTYWAGLQGATVVRLPAPLQANASTCHLASLSGTYAALIAMQADADQLRPVATALAAHALGHLAYAERQMGRDA